MIARGPELNDLVAEHEAPKTPDGARLGIEQVAKSNDSETPDRVGSKPQVEKVVDSNEEQVDLTPGQADEKAKEALNSEETKVILDKMKNIYERIEDIKNMPEKEKAFYYPAIQAYEQLKDDIQHKMEEDPNFQEAMKQVGEHLDKNDQPLDTIGEPAAGEMASEMLTNKETSRQIEKANYVISGYDKLNPDQQAALNKGLAIFKERIEEVATQLGLD